MNNPYEPENELQKAYSALAGGDCLCGHFESCSNCDGSLDEAKNAIKRLAKSTGYQLYHVSMRFKTPAKVDYRYLY